MSETFAMLKPDALKEMRVLGLLKNAWFLQPGNS